MQTRKILFFVSFGLFVLGAFVFACASPAAPPTAAPAQPTAAPAAQPTDAPAPPTETPTDLPNPQPTVIATCIPTNGEACTLGVGIELAAVENFHSDIKVIEILENDGADVFFPNLEKEIIAVHSFVNFRIMGEQGVLTDFKGNPMTLTIKSEQAWRGLAIAYCSAKTLDFEKCQHDIATIQEYMETCKDPESQCARESELFLYDSTAPSENAWGSLKETEFQITDPPMAEFVGTFESLEVGDPKVGCCKIPGH